MKKITFVLLSLLFASCNNYNSFDYPKTKTWKHGVYSKEDARKYEKVFDGLEVDVIFSIKKNRTCVKMAEWGQNMISGWYLYHFCVTPPYF